MAEGQLGSATVEAAGRAFACGDRVLAKHNDRRARIANGERGDVIAVDADRRSVTVRLQTQRTVVLESAYLHEGHLDHGYALTAHAAQGATVDRAFVLGSDHLDREWGYTALTRHRAEARFYLVSPGSVEQSLPEFEPQRDQLLDDLHEMLGNSRQKSLAIDVSQDDAARTAGESSEVLARYRAIAASERRRAKELAGPGSLGPGVRGAAGGRSRGTVGARRVGRRERAGPARRARRQRGASAGWRARARQRPS